MEIAAGQFAELSSIMVLCLTSSPIIWSFTWQFGLFSAKILSYWHGGMDKPCTGPLPSLVLGLASAVQLTHTSFFDFLSPVFHFPSVPSPPAPPLSIATQPTPHVLQSQAGLRTIPYSRHTDPCSGCVVPYCASYYTRKEKKKKKINRAIEYDTLDLTGKGKTAQGRKWEMM